MATKKKKKAASKTSSPKSLVVDVPLGGTSPQFSPQPQGAYKQPYQRCYQGTTAAGTNTLINESYPTKNIFITHVHIRLNDSLAVGTAAACLRDGVVGGVIYNIMWWQHVGDANIINIDFAEPFMLQRSVICQIVEFGAGGNPFTITLIGYLQDIDSIK